MSATYNFTLKQGTTFSLTGQVLVGSTGEPRDLTGYDIRSQMRPTYDSTISYAMTASIVEPTSGSFRLAMSSDSTSAVTASCMVYDVELYSGNIVERLLEGTISISPEVTK